MTAKSGSGGHGGKTRRLREARHRLRMDELLLFRDLAIPVCFGLVVYTDARRRD